MKLSFNKNLEGGSYKLSISLNLDEADATLIKKFGAPRISLAPQSAIARTDKGHYAFVSELPIHDLDGRSFSFTSEPEAKSFVQELTERIRIGMQSLRENKDDFTGTQVEEI